MATRHVMRAVESDEPENNYNPFKDDSEEEIQQRLEEPKPQPKQPLVQPPLDPIEVARQRVDQLVGDVADNTILELGKAVEEIQNVMQVLGDERKAIIGQVQKYADFASKAIKAKVIIAGHLVQLREEREG